MTRLDKILLVIAAAEFVVAALPEETRDRWICAAELRLRRRRLRKARAARVTNKLN